MVERERVREVATNGLLVVMSVALVLAGLEAALQVGLLSVDKNQHLYCQGPNNRFEFHPRYGYTEHPNSVYLEKRTARQDWSLFVHNDEGFRDVYNRGSNNVVILGDSFTRGTLVDQNATFAHLLDRWNPNTSFRNYGTGGYDTTNELAVYENVSGRYDHDLVILGYYMNDALTNDVNSTRKPRYVLTEGELVRVRPPVQSAGDPRESIFRRIYFDTPLRHLKSPQFLLSKIDAVRARFGNEGGNASRTPPSGDELRYKLNLTRALVRAIAQTAATNDANVLVVVIPNRGDVNPDRPHRFEVEDGRPFWEATRAMLRDLAAENRNVSVLDLREDLRAERAAGNRIYGEWNAHLDEAGHRVVARAIQDRLLTAGDFAAKDGDYARRYDTERRGCP